MHTDLLDKRMQLIANRTSCYMSKKQGKFDLSFEIRNLDFSKYIFVKENVQWDFIATCQLMEGTSDKPSYLSGNTAVQNRYSIYCKYKANASIPLFTIYETGFIRKIFKNKIIEIKCRDDNFKNYIEGLSEIVLLKEKIRDSAEISPLINQRKIKNEIELTIVFQSFTSELELFEAMIHFANRIVSKFKKQDNI